MNLKLEHAACLNDEMHLRLCRMTPHPHQRKCWPPQVAVSYTDSRAAAAKVAPSKLTAGQLLAATTASFTAPGEQAMDVVLQRGFP